MTQMNSLTAGTAFNKTSLTHEVLVTLGIGSYCSPLTLHIWKAVSDTSMASKYFDEESFF